MDRDGDDHDDDESEEHHLIPGVGVSADLCIFGDMVSVQRHLTSWHNQFVFSYFFVAGKVSSQPLNPSCQDQFLLNS